MLAHLLSPRDFGLASLAVVVAGFATVVGDLGIGGAIVHRQTTSSDELSSLFWLTAGVGLAITGVLMALAPVIAALFGEEGLTTPIRWIALAFIAMPIGAISRGLVEKDLAFRSLAVAEVTAGLSGFTVAVGSAAMGADTLAIVWGFLTLNVVRTLILMVVARRVWRPSMHFARADLKGYLDFGAALAGQRGVNYLAGNADFILVGGLLGPQALGYYALAYNLANVPSARINFVTNQVFFPLFARIQDDQSRVKAGYLRMQTFTTMINAPLVCGLAAVAPLLIPTIYGDRWEPAVVPLQILVGVGLTRAVAGTIGPLLLAKGRSDLGLRWALLVAALQVPAIYIGAEAGTIEAVALGFLAAQLIIVVLNYRILVRTLLGPCLREYLASMWRPLWISVVTAAVALPFALLRDDAADGMLLGAALGVSSTIFVLLNRAYNRADLQELLALIRNRSATA